MFVENVSAELKSPNDLRRYNTNVHVSVWLMHTIVFEFIIDNFVFVASITMTFSTGYRTFQSIYMCSLLYRKLLQNDRQDKNNMLLDLLSWGHNEQYSSDIK